MTQIQTTRRSILQKSATSLALTLLCGLSFSSWAQTTSPASNWPNKPVKFIVPFAAGGANDLLARAAAEGASKVLGRPYSLTTGQAQVARWVPCWALKARPMATHF
jgi:anaerobic selenocysteine-containing dehydrogenase